MGWENNGGVGEKMQLGSEQSKPPAGHVSGSEAGCIGEEKRGSGLGQRKQGEGEGSPLKMAI